MELSIQHQPEITWQMHQDLVKWMVHVYDHWKMLPETLWLVVNIMDRFCSQCCVIKDNYKLLGITAMFIVVKYEEKHIPSISHFVNMTDYSYSKKDILSTEPYVLKRLNFNLSNCSPYPWI